MNYIPYATQFIDEDDIAEVLNTLKSDFITTGPKIEEFERMLCDETGAKYAVAVSSGTSALHLALIAAGVTKGDEVITTPMTFAATANSIIYCGGTPVFADIDPETLLLDVVDVKRKITNKTKAIIPVHYGGELCDMDSFTNIANEYNLQIIQDSAHSLGGLIHGKKQGEYDGQQIWSFHPVKTITTGEGGAITTNNLNIYNKLVILRNHGITRDNKQFVNENEGCWYYEMLDLGFNYRITDIQCALGISQIKKLKTFSERRNEIVMKYNEEFSNLTLKLQKTPSWSNPVRHLYTIQLGNSSKRREVFDALRKKNIGVNVHYIPVYWHPYYARLGYKHGLCPITESVYKKIISIPLHPKLTNDQISYIIDCVKEILL